MPHREVVAIAEPGKKLEEHELLVLRQRDASDVRARCLGKIVCESSPAAADVEHAKVRREKKLGGEMAAQLVPDSLVIRTSFYDQLPFERACVDQWTSRMPVEEAARLVLELVRNTGLRGIVNAGRPERRNLYQIVKKEFRPDVKAARRAEFKTPFRLPPDSSLDSSKLARALGAAPAAARKVSRCRVCESADLRVKVRSR